MATTIKLYTKPAQRKLEAIAWAITYKMGKVG